MGNPKHKGKLLCCSFFVSRLTRFVSFCFLWSWLVLYWELLQVMITGAIKSHAASGEPIVEADAQSNNQIDNPEDVEARIRKVLNETIRPAVAMDGGDIEYVGFNAGVVLVQMRGACHACPSSALTLKVGIENKLKAEIPEVVEVTALS